MPSPARVRTATVRKLLAILKEAGVARFKSPEIEVEFGPAVPPEEPKPLERGDDPRLKVIQDLMPGFDLDA